MPNDPSSQQDPSRPVARPIIPRRWHAPLVIASLIVCAVLAVTSLLGDSPTFDEPAHLAAGYAMLTHHDYRLSAEHPPLGRLWCALPLLLSEPAWPVDEDPAWIDADAAPLATRWLFDLNRNGQQLVVAGRLMMVVLLLATCLATYALGRRLVGPDAGILALLLACLSPTLLAHGRLVTTDLPVTLFITLTLLAYARLLDRPTWPALIATGLALGAASVSKMSWPLVLPAMAAMFFALLARKPAQVDSEPGRLTGTHPPPDRPNLGPDHTRPKPDRKRGGSRAPAAASTPNASPNERLYPIILRLVASLALALFVWAAIWTAYGWRRPMLAPLPVGATAALEAEYQRSLDTINYQWFYAVNDEHKSPRPGIVPALCRYAQETGLLPDGYVFGLARASFINNTRDAYFMGECSDRGWLAFFPLALALKTPLATIALIFAGIAAVWFGRTRPRDAVLFAGLAAFIVIYGGYAIAARVNIGHRHLLPVYPALFAIAGGAATWAAQRWGRGLVGVALVWLLGANLWIHPNYLSYFNEIVGGPARGHLYFADSNIDWGQDLLRLRDYAKQHAGERIFLSYFGSARPLRYLTCEPLPSYFDFGPLANPAAGTYVISTTQLLGVYTPHIRRSFWTPRALDTLCTFESLEREPPPDDAPPDVLDRRAAAIAELPEWRGKLLISRLATRPPDGRIGWSMFVYRLTQSEVDALVTP